MTTNPQYQEDQEGQTGPIRRVNVKDAEAARSKGAALIDVRENHEYVQGHAGGARLVPLSWLKEANAEDIRALGLKTPIYVICRSGQRSMAACEILRQHQIVDVLNVDGGTLAWMEASLPISRG